MSLTGEPQREDFDNETDYKLALHRHFTDLKGPVKTPPPDTTFGTGVGMVVAWLLPIAVKLGLLVFLPGFVIGWLIDQVRMLFGAAAWNNSERMETGVAIMFVVIALALLLRFIFNAEFRLRWLRKGMVLAWIVFGFFGIIAAVALMAGNTSDPKINTALLISLLSAIAITVIKNLFERR